jgi:hypothetical protein
MERNYNNKEFEQYVKKNADQYRMIPSEKVWKGINNTLHTRRRWYTIGLSLLLLSTAITVTWVMTSYPDKPGSLSDSRPAVENENNTVPFDPVNPAQRSKIVPVTGDIVELLSLKKFDTPQPILSPGEELIAAPDLAIAFAEHGTDLVVRDVALRPLQANQAPGQSHQSGGIEDFSAVNTQGLKFFAPGDYFLASGPPSLESGKSNKHLVYFPLSIESVVNSYKPIRLPKRVSWQVYVTPTISYRRLSANKSYKNSGPFADPVIYPFTALTDVNKAVTHKPDMGLQIGFASRYPLTKNLMVRAGMQFNINRYDIKAYRNYSGEQATINLSGDNNSVMAWTYYRNYNGYKTDWLKNYYFSVSAPIGAELKLFGNANTSFGIAGTVQPTYILRDKAYLISTDYKNYAKVPWLVRRMNVNTSFETFVNFTSRNKTRWQIGPQVRYQVLSSFHDQYPVRENLFDFGLRMGVSLNQ